MISAGQQAAKAEYEPLVGRHPDSLQQPIVRDGLGESLNVAEVFSEAVADLDVADGNVRRAIHVWSPSLKTYREQG
jgi:hypothetical protein